MLKSNPKKADAERQIDITCPSTVHIHEITRGSLCCSTYVQVIVTQLLSCNPDQVTLHKNIKIILYFSSICDKWKSYASYQPSFFLLSITSNYYFQLLYYCLCFLALLQYSFVVGVEGGRNIRKVVVGKQ